MSSTPLRVSDQNTSALPLNEVTIAGPFCCDGDRLQTGFPSVIHAADAAVASRAAAMAAAIMAGHNMQQRMGDPLSGRFVGGVDADREAAPGALNDTRELDRGEDQRAASRHRSRRAVDLSQIT